MYCVLSRIETVTKALEQCPDDTPVVVLERSWFSDRHTFAEMLHKTGKISEMEWALYDEWYNFAVRNSPHIHGHLYLECTPSTCMDRLIKRSRTEETGVTTEYQKSLIEHHENWLQTISGERVCRVNVDRDFLGHQEFCSQVVDQVSTFVETLRKAKCC